MKSPKFALPVCRNVVALRRELSRQKKDLKSKVGMVPTMGALHDGHLSLIKKAASRNEIVILTIFVNPLQFGANEDLDSYPRRLVKDVELGQSAGATVVFSPTEDSFYSPLHQTTITNLPLKDKYCGEFRPGHFDGVLTVVAKLLMAGLPNEAFFGKKDYQQLYLIKRMVDDLNIPVRVFGVSTKREKSGLAMSSRNEYLTREQRNQAETIYQVLSEARKAIKSGGNWSKLRQRGIEKLYKIGFSEIQYFEHLAKTDLMPMKRSKKAGKIPKKDQGVLLIAGVIGQTRLIDNLEI